jgi:hypothetical protein
MIVISCKFMFVNKLLIGWTFTGQQLSANSK